MKELNQNLIFAENSDAVIEELLEREEFACTGETLGDCPVKVLN